MLILQTAKLTVLPYGITTKIKDFRTLLEIWSFVLACKQTDTNFVYYNLAEVFAVENVIFTKFNTFVYKRCIPAASQASRVSLSQMDD